MPSSNLQGLNVIHPASPPSNLTDAQDLLSAPLFPDFATHDLDLWTNINFASDEPFVSARDRELKATETEQGVDSLSRKEAGHSFAAPTSSPASNVTASQQPSFDFTRFLAEFGLSASADGAILPNAAGITQATFAAPPPALPVRALDTQTATSSGSTSAPAAKRARTSKGHTPAPSTATPSRSETPQPDISTPLTASEDKRRRNTAASARFRLKKKEREAALDSRAQALEDRVTSLERECEGLRRENGWLRGLVVGVTGGVVPAMSDAPMGPPASSAEKRKRDEEAT